VRRLIVSHNPHLTSAIRYLARTVFLVASGIPAVAWSQEIGPISFRDSLVMRQVAFRAPCPVPVPRAWTLMDSTLGSGPRCSLVERAVRALEIELQRRPALRERGDPRHPLCVRVVVRNNTGTTGLPGDWLVVFDLAADLPAYVMIDRQEGSVVLGIVGRGSPGDMPPCIGRK
jgi:hypothetical protein